MGDSANDWLVSLLRAEVEAARAETDAVRTSLRYRLGDVLLQALPLSLRSVRVIPKLFALLMTYRRGVRRRRPAGMAGVSFAALPVGALQCSQVIYKPDVSATSVVDGVLQTNDEGVLVARIDAGAIDLLVLYAVSEPIARRLARLQWQGCRFDCRADSTTPVVQYAQGLAVGAQAGDVR